jgi:hypothetical protein
VTASGRSPSTSSTSIPPFNSNADYNVLFKGPAGTQSAAQIEAFTDTWHWNDVAEAAFGDVMRSGNAATSTMLRAIRSFLGDNDMMAVRLLGPVFGAKPSSLFSSITTVGT